MTEDKLVLPIPEKLTKDGLVWHATLARFGWNELPASKKPGRIIGIYELKSLDGYVVDVYWPGVGFTIDDILLDELKKGGQGN